MANLRERLREDLKDAMRAGAVVPRDTIRLVEAAIKNAEIEQRGALEEADVIRLIRKQVRLREEAIVQFKKGRRQDLVDKETAEMAMLEGYLPAQLSRDEIVTAAQAAIERTAAQGPQDKGKVMGALMAELRDKADGRVVNEVVGELLGG